MKKAIADMCKGTVVVVGIGNTLRGDDGLGPQLIERIRGKVRAVCIDAGTTPESHTREMVNAHPDTILFIDAVHLHGVPGDYALLSKGDLIKSGLTTHDLSPALLIEYLEQHTTASLYMIGVQPDTVSFGDQMSVPVQKALNEIEAILKGALNARDPSD